MNIVPQREAVLLAFIPTVLIAMLYVVGSAERAANPNDKLLPPVSSWWTRRAIAFGPTGAP
jgi:NitT/TauT family transport system permease protein